MCFDSSSASTSASTTQNFDKRVVTGANSVGISGDGNAVQVLDGGAIAKAFDYAGSVNANASADYKTLLGAATQLTAQSAKVLDSTSAVVANAYDQAKGQGASAKMLSYGAMAVVGIVGIMAFRK